MKMHRFALRGLGFLVLWMLHCGSELAAAVPPDGWYDYSAYTDCRGQPEPALYNGGILKFGSSGGDPDGYRTTETGVFSPAFVVYNLNKTTMYTFSCWVKLEGAYSALITARLAPDNTGARCIATVVARSDCWAFVKGGFVLDWPTQTSVIFFQNADKTLFMNEYNVIETCDDPFSTVDTYVSKLKDLRSAGAILEGIGLEGHFSKPNIPLMRAILDKLATLGLPIWFTEIDISNKFDAQTQAAYLEQVLREAYSHPAVSGVMLWTALHPSGCYQMCLTDWNLSNLPTGDVVDRLLNEWRTLQAAGQTDAHGAYSFTGYLGEYVLTVSYNNRTTQSTFSLSPGDETRHINVQM
ncbi:Glycosyl hydrolase family 10 protein [Zea mays]|uniref:Glycosyl hydrolase family 10 protein n=1 Tax=Zea mays TaxID=4577 RepID=A0A1D6JVR8_MAIZE|nr:Glycosyl hydrolase family 10 protein [Zea mays]